MAYAPKSQLEDPNEPQGQAPGAPTASAPSLGATASMGGTAGNVGSGGLAQQGNAAQGQGGGQAGTGFMNIDRVLGANQNAGADLQKSANETAGAEKATFDKGAADTRAGIAAGTPSFNPGSIVSGLTTDTSKYADTVHHQAIEGGTIDYTTHDLVSGDDRSAGIKAAQDALSTTYGGPNGYKYDVGNTENAQTLKSMGDARTAGAALAQKGGALAQYNPGLSAIDQAIYGSAGQVGAVKQVGADTSAMLQGQADTQKAINSEARQAKAGVEGNVSHLRDVLGGIGRNMTSEGARTGSNANQNTLKAIGAALGDSTLGATAVTPLQQPTIAPQPVQPQAPTPNNAPNFQGDDLKSYQHMISLGYSPAQAAQWVKTNINNNVNADNTSGTGADVNADVAAERKRRGA